MSYVNQMANLRADLEETKKKTTVSVGETKRAAHKIQDNARKTVREFATQHKTNAKVLRNDLAESVLNLEEDVNKMRNTNKREQRELRSELKQGAAAFWGRSKPEK